MTGPALRIGLQIERYDPLRGGAERYTDQLTRRLLADQHEVHLFTRSVTDAPAGAIVHRIDPFVPEATRQAVRQTALDVVIGAGHCLGMNVYQPHGGTILGTMRQNLELLRPAWFRRCVTVLDQINPRRWSRWALERRQFNQTDPTPLIVVLSKMVRDDVRRHHQIDESRLHLVYNGVDIAAFSPTRAATLRESARRAWGLDEETICFLLVAHNFRLKGGYELLDALGRLSKSAPLWRMVIVGKGSTVGPRRHAHRRGIADQVVFVGSSSKIEHCYAAADAYVHPTWYDPCSLAIMEAWASGLPVISTRFNGAAELMTDGVEGFVIDRPDQADLLANRLQQLFDPQRRRQQALAARRLAEQHPLERNYQEILTVCRRAVEVAPLTVP